jgi:sulfite dehydrogenase (cytochrome) subunit B
MRAMKAILLAGCVMALGTAVWAAPAPAFKSLSVDLPPDVAVFPDGPNVKTVTQNCLACHSADMVLDQPLLPRATWTTEVTKMRTAYKAPISDADAALIVDYLAATHAPP